MTQLLALGAAFQVAVWRYEGDRPLGFLCGLVSGAALAHFGWALLSWEAARSARWVWLDPSVGYCVLFVPLGVLVFTRSPAAFRALPLAFAVARAGCLAAGCCGGRGGFPMPLFEIWNKGLTLTTTYASPPRDTMEALELIRCGRVTVDDLVSHRLPLEQAQEGFRLTATGESLKVVLEPGT